MVERSCMVVSAKSPVKAFWGRVYYIVFASVKVWTQSIGRESGLFITFGKLLRRIKWTPPLSSAFLVTKFSNIRACERLGRKSKLKAWAAARLAARRKKVEALNMGLLWLQWEEKYSHRDFILSFHSAVLLLCSQAQNIISSNQHIIHVEPTIRDTDI